MITDAMPLRAQCTHDAPFKHASDEAEEAAP
jgi:hypothetical protein